MSKKYAEIMNDYVGIMKECMGMFQVFSLRLAQYVANMTKYREICGKYEEIYRLSPRPCDLEKFRALSMYRLWGLKRAKRGERCRI